MAELHELTALEPRRVTQLGVSRSFQIPQLFNTLSVRENLELRDRYQGLAWHVRHKGIKPHPFAAPTLDMMERAFPARLELAARRYLASARKRARDILDTLICG